MAELLGTILITADKYDFLAGDVIKGFYDVDTDTISATKNDLAITVGGPLLVKPTNIDPNTGDYWSRTSTGYSVVVTNYDNGSQNVTISFPNLSGFPYFSRSLEINPDPPTEGDVNDISISLVSISDASATDVNDGEIVVAATGSNTPLKFSFNRPDIINGNTDGVFSNLSRGVYTIFAVDAKGYASKLIISVGVEGISHGVRWRLGFKNDVGLSGRVDIAERGYLGDVTEIKGGAVPFTHSTRGESRDIVDISIVSSQVDVSLINTELDQYIDVANGDDDKYKLTVYKDVSSSWVETWRGYINPESFSDAPNSLPYTTTLTATDRVADLKSREFLYNDEYIKGGENEFVVGNMTQLGVMKICLDKTKLDQGYRIACNIFEESHDEAFPPLTQTYINTNVYSGEDNVTSCDEVLKHILVLYDAMLVSWEGYWYIIRKKELLGTSVDYFEYDTNGIYVGIGSWTPRVDFKAATESNRYRWVGGMSRIMSSVFRKVILKINAVVNDKGLTKAFNSENAVYYADGGVADFLNTKLQYMRGFSLIQNGSLSSYLNTKFNDNEYWAIKYSTKGRSESFIQWNKDLVYSTNDKLVLDSSFLFYAQDETTDWTGTLYNNYPPYLIMRWSFKLGNKYLNVQGSWQDEDPLNQYFVDEFQKDVNLNVEISLPDGNSTVDTATLRVYPINLFDADISTSAANEELRLAEVATVDLDFGSRRVIYYNDREGFQNSDFLIYYTLSKSLEVADGVKTVVPNDQAEGKIWEKVTEYSKLSLVPSETRTVNSETLFDYIGLKFLPNGEDIPEEVTTHHTNNILNKVDYNKEIDLFDLTNSFNNDEEIFLNYTKRADTSPTTVWHEIGSVLTKPLQNFLVEWTQRLTKRTRMIISGTFFTDVEFTPINVLNDPSDSNRVFYPNGVSSDVKSRQYNGEIIEIGSDNVPESSQFSSAFSQEEHR